MAIRTSSVGVDPNVPYRLVAKVAVSVVGQGLLDTFNAHVELEWRDAADALLSTVIGDTVAVGRKFMACSASGRSPASATQARVRVVVEDLPIPEAGIGGFTEQGAFVDDVKLQRTR